jgi:hypothetical protein
VEKDNLKYIDSNKGYSDLIVLILTIHDDKLREKEYELKLFKVVLPVVDVCDLLLISRQHTFEMKGTPGKLNQSINE